MARRSVDGLKAVRTVASGSDFCDGAYFLLNKCLVKVVADEVTGIAKNHYCNVVGRIG